MIYYNLVSSVDGKNGTVFQAYKTKSSAFKNANKRFNSGVYKRVFIWIENTENPKENAVIFELKQDG